MTRAKIVILVALIWLVATTLYAYYYVVSILSSTEPYDAYAMNWQFQLLMFSIVRLPFLVIVLVLTIITALGLFELKHPRGTT
jgi:hypothetical protein